MKSLKRLIALVAVVSLVSLVAAGYSSAQEDNPVDAYNADQRVIYTDGVASWLMTGDPGREVDRYSKGQALPMLLVDGWKIASVTPAMNAKVGEGKTLIVLEKK